MKLVDRTPLPLVPADSAYSRDYWRWLDSHVLSASTGRRHRIPQHAELGLNGIHRIARPRTSWWRVLLRRTPWGDVAYLLIFAAILIAAIVLSGREFVHP